MSLPLQATRDQVLAFRLAGHNLAQQLPPGSLLDAAAACGVQNTPPGSAALALLARVCELTPEEVDRALAADKTLLQIRSLRTAPYLFPTRDIQVFTAGLLPEDEESLRFFIRGAGPALDEVGISATELVRRTAPALLDALDGRVLEFGPLARELTQRLSQQLAPEQLAAWRSASWYGPNQSLGEALVHFALYPLALTGLFCFAPRAGREASFVRTDQWLGSPLAQLAPEEARTGLVRRYLHCYGPTTAEDFGAWTGIAPAAARHAWQLVERELVEVDYGGRKTWLLRLDLAAFSSPPAAAGVRLLPPHDPYLQQRDRETLLPDERLHARVWRSAGNPGVVLAEGQLVATWRPRKQGKRLILSVEPLAAPAGQVRSAIATEADCLASFRGCAGADIVYLD